ncbi:MAG: ribbon-helix-helix domain-containing protein [Cyanobacteria bacterium P01_A01_bin.83]
MPVRKKLSTALNKASGKKDTTHLPQEQLQNKEISKSDLPPSRKGKKAIAGHFDPAVSKQLKQLALNEDKTVQDLLSEALNDLFEKYNLKPIA